jgi:long-subunit fatty acid transport protein
LIDLIFTTYRRNVMKKLLSCLLIFSMTVVPFSIQAAMIGTDQIVTTSVNQANRDKVIVFVNRSDVAKQLEAMGVRPAEAQSRVNAMTPDELNKVAANVDTMPAGAMAAGWWWTIGVVAVAWIIYLVWK